MRSRLSHREHARHATPCRHPDVASRRAIIDARARTREGKAITMPPRRDALPRDARRAVRAAHARARWRVMRARYTRKTR